ncbi:MULTISPECIES: hypothetical protein [Shewanella]|uniref:Uncharacterized protein n=1 Tax=Shewanella metallivivens TaxID=2872342 RepID=A0ABT5TIS9_9GAMM|nr:MULTISPECIES: hypothetical protein [Shewanella]MDD8058512.1 hypothetical protein [Shewanella metallivivens]
MSKSTPTSKAPATPRPSNNPNYPSTTGKPSGNGRGNVPKSK